MKWRVLQSQADADELMRIADCFHDWYLAGFEYDPLARTDGEDKNLARFIDETDSLLLSSGTIPETNRGYGRKSR